MYGVPENKRASPLVGDDQGRTSQRKRVNMSKMYQVVIAAILVIGCDPENDDDELGDVELRLAAPEDACEEALEAAAEGYDKACARKDWAAAEQYLEEFNDIANFCYPN